MSQIDTIYSTFDQLTTWEQYRDLLIETLTASGYPNLDNIIRSGFTENHFDNPELLAQFIVPLFSPHANISNALYSGTDPLSLLTRIDRSRELIVNGTFDTDLTGWTDASNVGYETTWEAGAAQLNGGGTGNTSRLRQQVPNLPAGTYLALAGGNFTALAYGTSQGGAEISAYSAAQSRIIINPQTQTVWINLAELSVRTLDNVSLRRID